jgi:tetratricopeptide (TPR) repeat protein
MGLGWVMSMRVFKWVGIAVTAATILGLIAYFADVGLNEANEMAGPISAVTGVIGIGLTVYGMAGAKQPPPAGKDGDTKNTVKGGVFHAPVLLGREIHYDSRKPDGKEQPGASDPGTPRSRLAMAGKTTSIIKDGMFFSAVIMGRNIRVQLPPEITPALAGLPGGTEAFSGREGDMEAVLTTLAPAPDPAAQKKRQLIVTGMPGVGKTELAIHAAHAALANGWFAGGVLYADVFGYDPSRRREAGQVLDGFLRCLGIPGESIPPEGEERARLYSTVLAKYVEQSRPILVVIDNASAADQVAALLPGDRTTGVIVTSRENLGMLDLRRFDLDVLPAGEAVQLLDLALRIIDPDDERVAGQPAEAAGIGELCGGLPLALRIVAALLSDDRGRPLAEMAADLSDAGSRLEEMRYEDVAVRAAFDLSYRRLSSGLSQLFGLLPVVPGPDVSAESAAVLTGTGEAAARRDLESLARSHLIEGGNGRWRMHDLIRLYAAEQVVAPAETGGQPANGGGREQARDRILRHFLRMALDGDQWFGNRSRKPVPDVFADRDKALRWLDAERDGLVAAVSVAADSGNARIAIDLAGSLARYLGWRRRFDDAILVAGTGLKQARLADRLSDEAQSLLHLGIAWQGSRGFTTAIGFYAEAAKAYQRAGDRHGEAMARNNLIGTLVENRQFDDAIKAQPAATALYREIGDRGCEGMTLDNTGNALREVGRFDEAITSHSEARKIFQAIGDQEHEASALVGLGIALQQVDRFPEAVKAGEDALLILRATGNRRGEGMALASLGGALLRTARFDDASQVLQEAASAFKETADRQGEGTVLLNQASVWQQTRQFEKAAAAMKEAAGAFRETGDRHGQGTALRSLGILRQGQGDHEQALAAFEEALPPLRASGDLRLTGIVQVCAGHQLAQLRRFADAIPYFQDAASSFRQARKPQDEGRALMGLGAALQAIRRLDEAAGTLRDAAGAFSRAGDQHQEAIALGGAGAVLRLTDRLDEAIDRYREAATGFSRTGDRRGEGMILGSLANALVSANRTEEAATALQRASSIFEELGDNRLQTMAADQLRALRDQN